MKALTFVELDIPYCALTYGVAPCVAAIPTTGAIKCFNSIATCQDRENFTDAPVTLRFAAPTNYLPKDIPAIASIKSVSFTPGTVSLGEDLGQRATLSVSFGDHRWPDTGPGFDKYVAERDYDPFRQGTFWGKFRARQPYLRGRPIRLIQGVLGQAIEEMEVRHYVVESFDGPTPDGTYTLTAKDVLQLATGDRAQAPRLSNGFLVAPITDTDVSATLSPAGVGDGEYPSSGYVAIGGKEICAFTRSGDTLSLTRAQLGTDAVAHDTQDRVQIALRYTAQDPANIIADLLETYAGVDPAFIPVDAWLNETSNFYRRLLTGTIAEPTSVSDLCSEIIAQAALAMWWSDRTEQIRLQVLRAIATNADIFTQSRWLQGSLGVKEQPEKRLSQVWVYFGQRNPLNQQDDPDNYRSAAIVIDLQAETDYGTPAIKKVYSRWMPAFARPAALRLGQILVGRFRDPPRALSFGLFRTPGEEPVVQGGGYQIGGQSLQDATGAEVLVPVQVTRLNPRPDGFDVESEEMIFVDLGDDEVGRTIIIDSNSFNLDLREIYDTLYPAPVDGDEVTCIVEAGVTVGSTSTANPAFKIGSWPSGVHITLDVKGRIEGKGGKGADVLPGALNGEAGGTALYARYAIDLKVSTGKILGGGGGGAAIPNSYIYGPAGGGGAGAQPGAGGVNTRKPEMNGNPGTADAGGLGGAAGPLHGGAGGGPGLAGASSSGGTGGAAGTAIDGISYITITEGPGDIRGPEIN